MAKGTINKVILIGNLGRDPEVRYAPTGFAVANLAIATTESWKDKQSGENQERTEWHRVVLYQRLAEIAGEYLRKGAKVFVEGRIQTRKWQDKNTGQDRFTTEIIADTLQMLDSKGTAGASMEMPIPSMAASEKSFSAETPAAPVIDQFEDEIPF